MLNKNFEIMEKNTPATEADSVDDLEGFDLSSKSTDKVGGKSKVDVVKYVRDTAPMSLGEAKAWVESKLPQLDAPTE